jgi:hypothetical protein
MFDLGHSYSSQQFQRSMRARIEQERRLLRELHDKFVDPGLKEEVSDDARRIDILNEWLYRSDELLRDPMTRARLSNELRRAVKRRERWQRRLTKYGPNGFWQRQL